MNVKLIDILVRELPMLGGWPEDKTVASHGPKNCVMFHELGRAPFVYAGLKFEGNDIVTKEEYEAELAASKPEWNGEGLPPVGCEFEFRANVNSSWKRGVMCVVDYTNPFNVVVDDKCGIYRVHELEFRPIRSEADKKKEEAMKAIDDAQSQVFDQDSTFSEYLYDAIAAGKIPHIRID